MRVRSLVSALAIVALWTGVASAATLYDDFLGSSLDGKWAVTQGGPVTVGGGELFLDSEPGLDDQVQTVNRDFTNGTDVVFKLGSTAPTGTVGFGLSAAGGPREVQLWNLTQGGGTWSLFFGGGAGDIVLPSGAPVANERFRIESGYNSGNGVRLYRDLGTGIESLEAALDTYDLVTDSPYKAQLFSFGGTIAFDYISTGAGVVPEPSGIIMITSAVLGLLCYAWRRRK